MKFAVAMIILGLIVLFLYPFGLIWSLNVLFNCQIPYTFSTYSAAFLLSSLFLSFGKVT